MYRQQHFKTWAGRCPRHPGYNPTKQGEGGIRGNCPGCWKLYELEHAGRNLEKTRREAANLLADMATPPPFTARLRPMEAVHG